jgi:predicted NAD/FAD-binding protein
MKPTLAIIGSGISGLGCAFFLKDQFDITIIEKNSRLGGHTNTIIVEDDGCPIPIDTGFMVFNQVTYPLLCRFFKELGVDTYPTRMSFSVQHPEARLEYCGSSYAHLFAQKRNLFRPRFWKMLNDIRRFNQRASKLAATGQEPDCTLSDFCRAEGYGEELLEWYLLPMSGAVWSTSPKAMRAFPAKTLIRFFYNHGFLGMHTHHQWFTVEGGAKTYIERLMMRCPARVILSAKVVRLHFSGGKVALEIESGEQLFFDYAICASHADETGAYLDGSFVEERTRLAPFHYNRNVAILHRDESVMPRRRACWSSWNYTCQSAKDEASEAATVHYWMNSLQRLNTKNNYFVSLNSAQKIDENKIERVIHYTHPCFDLCSLAAQNELQGINCLHKEQRVFFCGAYFSYGFHEDGLESARNLCEVLLGRDIWR